MTLEAANPGTNADVYFDPYDVGINADPYPVFARLREEAPLYYNAQHDFYAVSRYEDVNRGIVDHGTFSSAKGAILELIRADFPIPSGVLIFEDPPIHDIHRKLLARMFTPRKIALLEQRIRDYCVESLDAVVGAGRFDFVADFGAVMPMKTISALIGIPEADQVAVRDHVTGQMKTEAGKPMKAAEEGLVSGDIFADYIDWRVDNPSDDIMTELLNVEFADETGTTRRLTRDELLIYLNVVAGAGNDTTTRLIGWAAKVLAEHPDQRRQLVDDPTLIPRAVEELVRFEPPAPHVARYVTRDVEIHGQTVPQGAIMMMLIGAANRDHRQFPPDGDVFDIHREQRAHLGFSVGAHYCLGSSLARLEGRVALEEILKRFPEWEVDLASAVFSTTSTIRGWESMPAII
ncbi:cytochrome P450 [Mycolicibacterium madagascariense]|uniref:Steroid C26-monooxygenase n=1 Tax=Mycolicibacterium madagascariense TaxID=212765 RepID=A0A7I7XPD1_9MYCO|nr:cytochrome P450 [Mycolicibacterium madagascariense]MCV7015506.1 cytochrome P450 [Mycolicibacterium madagascariense]BBZ30984.1 cytochrome P450 [Mycolicibacterium madagascariense]